MPRNLLLISNNADLAAELDTIVRFLGHELTVAGSASGLGDRLRRQTMYP